MREHDGMRWLTIPATGKVEIVHKVELDRLVNPRPGPVGYEATKGELDARKRDLIGEVFRIGMVPQHIGPTTHWHTLVVLGQFKWRP